jgi:predicted site-specific integrase-resolvase
MTIKRGILIDNEAYYSVKDLVNILNLTELTIRDYLRNGKLKGNKNKVNRFWYIKGVDLRQFLQSNKRRRFLGVF